MSEHEDSKKERIYGYIKIVSSSILVYLILETYNETPFKPRVNEIFANRFGIWLL